MSKAGLSLSKLAASRTGRYEGPPVSELPRLTAREKELIQAHLDAQVQQPKEPSGSSILAASSFINFAATIEVMFWRSR